MSPQLLLISGDTADARETVARMISDRLLADPTLALNAVARWLANLPARRYRMSLVATSAEEAAARLLNPQHSGVWRDEVPSVPSLAVLLPGVGEQYGTMVTEVYQRVAPFAVTFDRCATIAIEETGLDIRSVLDLTGATPGGHGSAQLNLRALMGMTATDGALGDTRIAQLLTFATEAALIEVLAHCGLAPAALLGYSIGEYAAAYAAGVFGLDAAVRVVARRAELIAASPPGGMLAVAGPAAKLAELIAEVGNPFLVVAADGPSLSVASGPLAAVEALHRRVAATGAAAARLPVRQAFHSPLLHDVEPALAAVVDAASPRSPHTPMLSNLTGGWLSESDALDGRQWARQASHPVRFDENLTHLWTLPRPLLMEIGPGSTLGTLAAQHRCAPPERRIVSTIPGSHHQGSRLGHLLTAIGRVWAAGVDLDRVALAGLVSNEP
jgi:acyl transferase domain-containing protein